MNVVQQNINPIFVYSYIFIIGMCLGSFFMVVGYRIPRKETLMGKSHCEHCQNQLRWWQVIPLFSYILLKGKCSFCTSKIGVIYPILEVFIGFLFVASAYFLRLTPEVLVSFTFICLLFTISVSDILYRIIPNKVLLPFLIVGLIERLLIPQNDSWWYPLVGILAGFLPLFLIGLLKEQAIGGGDIKLFAVVGIFIGPIGVLISLFLSSVIAIIFHVFSFFSSKEKQKYIPFGPSIAIGSLIIYLFTSGQIEAITQLFM
ncbi:prepilin peptidase [Isobaculum melis]|uniref:Type 4 prepilin peptidase 1 Aspartic peptidase. MEROPS family A24A n=1 Tax=Isobaculum melis TaxID=142588 RepID=A0A1H9S3E1_9LACT|nr:A24 family peptidase [Isobaculum melis]SER79542.1 type 4 prepilin peptidase 1 Aspartic peptidase. MEROPS family A24A [Isobaculum melis]